MLTYEKLELIKEELLVPIIRLENDGSGRQGISVFGRTGTRKQDFKFQNFPLECFPERESKERNR